MRDNIPADPHARAMAAGLAAVEQAHAAPARPSGPGTCPDGQPHRWRPLTTGERIGHGEMASERELDAARKCNECGAWSDAASVVREARKSARPVFRGFDGKPYTLGDRIEIHPGTDLWMQGARYGDVVGCSSTPNDRVKVNLDRTGKRLWSGPENRFRKLAAQS